nr:hypothetical protein [Tanacetum cinerariifolium]
GEGGGNVVMMMDLVVFIGGDEGGDLM